MCKYIYISLFSLILFSCKTKEETFDIGADYFPIKPKGSYIIYDVQRIIYGASGPDTSNYQLMEMVGDTALLNGQLYYKVWRYTRPDASGTWPAQPDSVWEEYNNTAQAVKIENNRRFVKLVFPVTENKTWNGNVMNTYPSDDYIMQRVGRSYTVNGHYFPITLKVVQGNDTSLVNEDQRYEVYAKGIGLVDKYINTVLLCSNPSCISAKITSNKDSIIGGIRYRQKFISYQ
ncbi:MAG TPA: hypothetical protein VNW99_12065 [Cytophagaceae bacterium]|jgi:hypothetical protein|nr:hypothetical protein [Cytophagaceae bacterium]